MLSAYCCFMPQAVKRTKALTIEHSQLLVTTKKQTQACYKIQGSCEQCKTLIVCQCTPDLFVGAAARLMLPCLQFRQWRRQQLLLLLWLLL